jgi:hypothetical protein
MSLLIDENVPDSVAIFLRERGHAVYLSHDVLAQGAKDHVIARLGDSMASIVVTFDRDFQEAGLPGTGGREAAVSPPGQNKPALPGPSKPGAHHEVHRRHRVPL